MRPGFKSGNLVIAVGFWLTDLNSLSLWLSRANGFLGKLKRELLYDPAIPLLGMYPDITIIKKVHVLLCS